MYPRGQRLAGRRLGDGGLVAPAKSPAGPLPPWKVVPPGQGTPAQEAPHADGGHTVECSQTCFYAGGGTCVERVEREQGCFDGAPLVRVIQECADEGLLSCGAPPEGGPEGAAPVGSFGGGLPATVAGFPTTWLVYGVIGLLLWRVVRG